MAARHREKGQVVARNRAATFHYTIEERFEAGLVLRGSEVKSLREGRVNLTEAYASVERGEAWIKQLVIASYVAARAFPHAEHGARKLLLHAREIRALERASLREGYTLVPLAIYFDHGWAKVTIGVARGRKDHDKRAVLAARTAEREALAAMREHRDASPRRRRR